MELILHILAGAAVGFAIGLTGVGGGSLMTPLLLLFGYPAPIAIGTDLLYAAITKAGGAFSHHRAGNVDWHIVRPLAYGSVPTALIVHVLIAQTNFHNSPRFEQLLTFSLGLMLIITSIVLIIRTKLVGNKLVGKSAQDRPQLMVGFIHRNRGRLTFLMGIVLGVCVTLSSVGAGAFAAAILLTIYSRTAAVKIIGSDIAHAVPLTFIAGLGYLFAGYVDLLLLLSLLIGSLPAIALGSHLSSRVPERSLQSLLILFLFSLGLYYTIFNNLH
ncbi:MAG: sulfite exporter TauE/SafE family protein [Pseudohongiellaceae bacterium]